MKLFNNFLIFLKKILQISKHLTILLGKNVVKISIFAQLIENIKKEIVFTVTN